MGVGGTRRLPTDWRMLAQYLVDWLWTGRPWVLLSWQTCRLREILGKEHHLSYAVAVSPWPYCKENMRSGRSLVSAMTGIPQLPQRLLQRSDVRFSRLRCKGLSRDLCATGGGRVGQTRFFASSLLPALGHVASSCFAEAGGSGGRVLHRRGCLCSWSLGQRTWGYKFRKRWGLRIGRMRIEPEVPLEEVQDKSAGSHDNVTLPREQKRFAVFCSGGFLCCPPTSWANYVAKISGWVRDVDMRPLEAAIFYRWCNEALAAGQAHGRAALVVNMWSKRSARACSREARRVLTVEWAGWAGHHWASLGASHAFYLGGWRKTNVFSFANDFYDRG